MKRILLIFLFTTIIHGQVYDNIETAIGNLVNDLRNDVEISFNSRSIIGSISTGRNIPSKIAEKIRKEIIRSHNLRNGFNIISNEYTNYISKKLSNLERYRTYYFYVTAVNDYGVESSGSNIVNITIN